MSKTNDDSQWREKLSDDQFSICRLKATEAPFTGEYWNTKDPGVYRCVACEKPLFSSDTKFDSGSGWPSFWDAIQIQNLKLITDRTHGMERTEVTCAACGSHLGHVFEDGPRPTGLRYCINSGALKLDRAPSPKKA